MHSVFPGLPASLRPVLEDALPAYSDAVAQLDLALNASHPASSLFVHAPSNQKLVAAIVQERLSRRAVVHDAPTVQDALPKVVAVDLQDLRSPRVLYDRVLNLFAAWEAEARWEAKLPNVAENWNARQDGVSVREQRENSGDVGGGADEMERGEREWTVCWDNDSEDPSLTAANSSRTNESLDGFYQGLRDIATIGGAGTPPQRRYLIVENANFLEDLASAGSHQGAPKETGIGMTFAAALLQLERLSQIPITVILISTLSWTKLRGAMVGLTDPPETVSFVQPLGRTDIVNLLSARFAEIHVDENRQLFSDLVSLLHDTFASQVGSHLDELSFLAAKFWPRWRGFVQSGQVEASNVSRLGAFLKEDLGNEIRRLANNRLALNPSPSNTVTQVNSVLPGFTGTIPDLPSSSTTTFTTPERRLPSSYLPVNTSPTKVRAQASDQSLAASLPVMAKYLLVASFFASFNSVKSDVVHFVKIDEGIAKKGKRGRKAVAKKPGTGLKAKLMQDKLGPKAFPLERLLAIFEAILPDNLEKSSQTVDILSLVSTLINLRLLGRVTSQDKSLDGVKLKCKVNRETVDMLAQSVKYKDWTEYLTHGES